jgi:hypothetical protein
MRTLFALIMWFTAAQVLAGQLVTATGPGAATTHTHIVAQTQWPNESQPQGCKCSLSVQNTGD